MKKIIFAACLAFCSASAMAGGAASGGASEWTQVVNMVTLTDSYAQQALTYQNAILQYGNLVQQLQKNPMGVALPNLSLLATNQARITAMGQNIATDMGTVDQKFAAAFKNPQAGSFGVKFGMWTNNSLDALRTASANAGLHAESVKADNASMQNLVNASVAARGTTGALDALAGINAAQLDQSIKLRDLIGQQQQAQNTYMAAQASKEQAKQDQAVGFGLAPAPPLSAYKKYSF